jgi:hypothetical protein
LIFAKLTVKNQINSTEKVGSQYQKCSILSPNFDSTNMKLKLQANLKYSFTAIVAISAAVFSVFSCTKKNLSDDGKKFVGTWAGSYVCIGAATTGSTTNAVINKGKDDATVTLDFVVGASSACAANKELQGDAGDNNVTFGKQTFTDACGGVWQISGTATLYRDTLTLTWTGTGTTSGTGTITGSCTFRGKKQ